MDETALYLLLLGVGVVLAGGIAFAVWLRRRRDPDEPPLLTEELSEEAIHIPPRRGEEALRPGQRLEPAARKAPARPPAADDGGLFQRLVVGLSRTRNAFGEQLDAVLRRGRIDESVFEALEEALILADVGVRATARILEGVRKDARTAGLTETRELRALLRKRLVEILSRHAGDIAPVPKDGPLVVLVVGVNGGGKTTTIGKLCARFGWMGHKVVVGAGDTFRAGAIEQLRIWAERAGADFVAHEEGSDPSAVLFDTLQAARARGCDVVICDTAGRLQSRKPLMDELGKVTRVLAKAQPGAPHEVLLVLDATIGQNALSQARTFGEVVGVTGIVLTKLDGTAKGGVVVAVCEETGLPVKYIGVGEKVDDLRPFDPKQFADALIPPEEAPVSGA